MHIPLISKIKEGEVVLRMGKDEKKVKVSSGILEVRPHSEVYLLVDRAE
jgi:F0F1-type ATP synthase epsilon subunit